MYLFYRVSTYSITSMPMVLGIMSILGTEYHVYTYDIASIPTGIVSVPRDGNGISELSIYCV